MQNRSSYLTVFDNKEFPDAFRANCVRYTQHYSEDNTLHFHNCLEIGMCCSGSGVECIEDKIYPFFRNSITFIQKNCVHDAHIVMRSPDDPPSEWSFIFVDLDALGLSIDFKKSLLTNDAELSSLFSMMFNELEQKTDRYQSVFLMLLKSFIIKLGRCVPQNYSDQGQMPERLVPAINFIAQNYNKNINISQIASSCNMSVSYFRKLFKEHLNCSPLEYLNEVRISVAKYMLQTTDIPILQISEDVGFSSLSSFNRLFKRNYRISPREVRNQRKGKKNGL